ncbi:unnamed protein product [Ectocarpus fasciculatus]
MSQELTDEQLRSIYAWIDAVPLSRPKRNIARDFSDGVLLAEVVAAYFPDLVELHNYGPANSSQQKVYNIESLNNRVLRKIGFQLTKSQIEDIVSCRTGAIEYVLNTLQFKMAKYRERRAQRQMRSPRNSGSDVGSPMSHQSPAQPSPAVQPREEQRRAAPRAAAPVAAPKSNSKAPKPTVKASVSEEILVEKEQQIRELQETVEILTLKISKLEQLVRLKDNKILKLSQQQN